MFAVSLLASALLLIGAWSYRRARSTEAFAVAGRTAPGWLVAGSLVATIVGGSSTLGMAGLAFSKGLVGAWWLLGGVVGLLVLAVTLVERVRSAEVFTLPELLGQQYGTGVKAVASVLIAVAWLGIIAGQMVGAGQVLTVISPWPQADSIAVAGLVLIVYAFLGGQHSILRTDALQCVVLVVGILVCAFAGVQESGGLGELRRALPPGHLAFPLRDSTDLPFVTRMLVLVGSTYLVGPDIYSRLFCARDARAARTAVIGAVLVLVPVAVAVVTVGLTARAQFPYIEAEQAFPTVVAELLPKTSAVLVVAGLLAALMSSADTCLVTVSVIVGIDLIRDHLAPSLDPPRQLSLCRICVLVLGGLSLLVALQLQNVIQSLMLGYTIYTAGLVIPALAGFWREKLRLNAAGAIAAVVVGGGLAVWAKFGGPANMDLIAVGASGAALVVGSRIGAALAADR
jgi:SSS family solute:Na+ symporter